MLSKRKHCIIRSLTSKPDERAFRFCDCEEICLLVEWAHDCLLCYRTAGEGRSRHAFFPWFHIRGLPYMMSAVCGGRGYPKSRRKEKNQLICDIDRGRGVKKSQNFADVMYGSPLMRIYTRAACCIIVAWFCHSHFSQANVEMVEENRCLRRFLVWLEVPTNDSFLPRTTIAREGREGRNKETAGLTPSDREGSDLRYWWIWNPVLGGNSIGFFGRLNHGLTRSRSFLGRRPYLGGLLGGLKILLNCHPELSTFHDTWRLIGVQVFESKIPVSVEIT